MRRRDLLALFLALAVYPAHARADDDDDDDDDHDDVLRGVADQRVLELEDLLRRFAEQIDGKVVDIELREDDDRLVFRITYVAPDGHVRRATLDAATGNVVN